MKRRGRSWACWSSSSGLRHWSQADLARASGIQKSQISLYELWTTAPSEMNLKRLAAAAWIPWAAARQALPALRALVRMATRPAGGRPALPGTRRTAAAVGHAAAEAVRRTVLPFLQDRLPALAGPDRPATAPLPDRSGDRAALGLLIVLLRSLRHWTQVGLASASGVQRSQISAYELWKRTPRTRTLERLATAVGVPLAEARGVLPFLRELVRTSLGRPDEKTGLADRIERAAEDFFLLEVAPFVSERLSVGDDLKQVGRPAAQVEPDLALSCPT